MTAASPPRLGAYARAIERYWSTVTGGPVVLSPRDWERIVDWHTRGIPLQIVRESMAAVAERRVRMRGLLSLSRVAPAVDEAWEVVLDGRMGRETAGAGLPPDGRSTIDSWRSLLAAEPQDSRLARLLASAIRLVEQGESPSAVDRRLDEGILDAVSEPILRAAQRAADEALEPFRDRMDAPTLAATRIRIVLARLRRDLRLPRLDRDPES